MNLDHQDAQTMHPFTINVPQTRLDAIRASILAFDWSILPTLAEGGDPWSAGTDPAFLRPVRGSK